MAAEMVGREAELGAVARFLDDVGAGPSMLVLSGQAGIGKTTVWEAGVDQALRRGYSVFVCRPAAAEVRSSYAGLVDLFAGAYLGGFEHLPRPQARALDAALLRGSDDESSPDPRAVAVGLLSVLEERASTTPVVLAVDDLQWLDAATERALAFAVRRCAGPVGVLVSLRIDDLSAPPPDLQPRDPTRVAHVPIGPLDLAALHRVVKGNLGGPVSRSAMVRIAEVSGGNPFFAIELAKSRSTALPERLRDLVIPRFAGLAPPVREALLVVSALGMPPVEVVERALSGPIAELLGPAEDLRLVEITGGVVRFRHPLLAEAVYGDASPGQRRTLHRRLAEVVDGPEERARHLARAATGPEPDTVAALDDAARFARRRGLPTTAAELLELAIALGADEPSRRIQAAQHHLDAGDPTRAGELAAHAVAELGPGPARAVGLCVLGCARCQTNDLAAAVEVLQRAHVEAGADRRLRVSIASELIFPLGNSGRSAEALDYLALGVAEAEILGDSSLLAELVSGQVVYRFLHGEPLDEASLARALALEDPGRPSRAMRWPSTNAALVHLWSCRLDLARTEFADLRRRCLDRGEENDLWFVQYYELVAACAVGEVEVAEGLLKDASEGAFLSGTDFARGMALGMATTYRAWVGQVPEARSAASEAAALLAASGMAAGHLVVLGAMGMLELSVGDHAAAARALGPAALSMVALGLREPAMVPFLPDAVEALVAVGRADEAEPLVALLEENGRVADRMWARAVGARCRGVLLSATGDFDDAQAAFDRSLAIHDELPVRYDRARTLLVHGRLQRRRKDRHRARLSFEEAVRLFEDVGTGQWAVIARRALDRVNPRHRPPTQLSPTEQRVAELAATGLTNRDVAAALFVSAKTVEANLSRVYRKLGIHSRAGLGRWLVEQGSAPTD